MESDLLKFLNNDYEPKDKESLLRKIIDKTDDSIIPLNIIDEGFKDLYDKDCSIQLSSLAGDDAIWFGVNGVKKRMHLNREQVAELLPTLIRFVEKGVL